MAFSPNGKWLASVSGMKFENPGSVKLWNLQTDNVQTLEGDNAPVSSVIFTPDGRLLATGSWNEIKLWDIATRKLLRTLRENDENSTVELFSVSSHVVGQPSSAEEYAARGVDRLYGENDAVGAIEDFKIALGKKPSNVEWRYHQGVAASMTGENDYLVLAIKSFKAYLHMIPQGKYATEARRRLREIEPTAKINKVWVDSEARRSKSEGMLIHIDFSIDHARYQECEVVAFFYHDNGSGNVVKSLIPGFQSTEDGLVVGKKFTPRYDGSRYSDFHLFLPESVWQKAEAGKTKGKRTITLVLSYAEIVMIGRNSVNHMKNIFIGSENKTLILFLSVEVIANGNY